MKKISYICLSILVLTYSVFTACEKDDSNNPPTNNNPTPDTTPPVITIMGANPSTVSLYAPYVDPGATATDDVDGNITSHVTVTNNIDTSLIGTYSVTYSVSDSAGNSATASRTVIVIATPAALVANYSVVDTCATSIVFLYSQTIAAVNSTTIQFSLFADYSSNTGITATIASDGTITIPLQTALNIGSLGEDHRFSGTGHVTVNGIFLDYTDENLTVSATAQCKAYYTRQ